MGNLLGGMWSAVTHVFSMDETTMATTDEEVCFEVNSLFHFREKIIKQYFAILLRLTALWISSVNLDFAKSYQTLSEIDSCQCLRTSVDYLTFPITLQVCKFLDVTSASPAPLRKNFPTVAAIVVSSAQTTCVTADHVRPNNFHIYHAITFIFRVIFWFHHAINLL